MWFTKLFNKLFHRTTHNHNYCPKCGLVQWRIDKRSLDDLKKNQYSTVCKNCGFIKKVRMND